MKQAWFALFGALFVASACGSPSVPPGHLSDHTVAPDVSQAATSLYPGDTFAQTVFTNLVTIMHLHRTTDPFLGGPAPGFSGFGMDRVTIGFYIHTTEEKTDLRVRSV